MELARHFTVLFLAGGVNSIHMCSCAHFSITVNCALICIMYQLPIDRASIHIIFCISKVVVQMLLTKYFITNKIVLLLNTITTVNNMTTVVQYFQLLHHSLF